MKTKFRMLSALVAVAMLATVLSFGTLSVAATAPDGYTQAGTSELCYKVAAHDKLSGYAGNALYITAVDGDANGSINIEGAAAAIKAATAEASAVVIDASVTAIGAGWFDGTNVGAVVVEGSESSPALTIDADAFSGMTKLRELIIARDNITWTGLDAETTVEGLLNADGASAKTGGINIFVADNDVAAALQALDNTATLDKVGTERTVTKPYARGIFDITTTVDWKFRIGTENTSQWIDWVFSDGTLVYDLAVENRAVANCLVNYPRAQAADAEKDWRAHNNDIKKIVIGEDIHDFNGGYNWGFGDSGKSLYPNLEELVLPSTFKTFSQQDFFGANELSKINLEDTVVTEIGSNAFAGTKLGTIELPATITTVADGGLCADEVNEMQVIVNGPCPSGFSTSAFTRSGVTTPSSVTIQVKNAADLASWQTKFSGSTQVSVVQYVEPSEPEQPGDGDDDDDDTPTITVPDGYTQAGNSEVCYKVAAHDKLIDDEGNALYITAVDGDESGSINIEGAAAAIKAAATVNTVVIDASVTAIGDGWFDGTNVGAVVIEGAADSSVTIGAGSFKNMPKLREIIIARDNITWTGLDTADTVDGLLNPAGASGKTGGINIFVADDDVAAALQDLDNTATLQKVGVKHYDINSGVSTVTKPYATGIYDITTTVDWRCRLASGVYGRVDWVYSDGTLYYDIDEENGSYRSVVCQQDKLLTTAWGWKDYREAIKKIVIGEGLVDFNSSYNWAVNSDTTTLYPNLEELVLPSTFTLIEQQAFWKAEKLSKINLEDTAVTEIGSNAFATTKLGTIELPATITTVADGALTADKVSELQVIVNGPCPSGFSANAFVRSGSKIPASVTIQVKNSEHLASWQTKFSGSEQVSVVQYVEPSEPDQPGDGGDDDEPIVDADGYTQAGTSELWWKVAAHDKLSGYVGNALYIKAVDGDESGSINIEGAAAAIKAEAATVDAVVIDASVTAIGAGWFDGTNVGAIVVEGAESSPALTIAADAFSGMSKLRELIIARNDITWTGLDAETTVDGLLNADGASAKTGGINIFIADDDVAAAVQALDNTATLQKVGDVSTVTKLYARGIFDITTTVDWKFRIGTEGTLGWIDWVFSDGTLVYDLAVENRESNTVLYPRGQAANAEKDWHAHYADIKKIVIGEGITEFNGGYNWGVSDSTTDTLYPNLEEVVLPSTFTNIDQQDLWKAVNLSKINLEDTAVTTIGSWAFATTKIGIIELPATITTVAEGAFTADGVNEMLVIVNGACPSGFSADAFVRGGNTIPASVTIQVKNSEHLASWQTKFSGNNKISVELYNPLRITALEISDYKASFTYEHASDGTTPQNYVLIIAAYNSAGALVDVEFVDSTAEGGTPIAVGTSGTITTAAVEANPDYTYKAMLWDGFSTLKPLAAAVTQ